jgi:hypothetical protein
MLMEDREREKEKMRGDGVDAQKLSEADLLVSCPTLCCFSFRRKCSVCDTTGDGLVFRLMQWSAQLVLLGT